MAFAFLCWASWIAFRFSQRFFFRRKLLFLLQKILAETGYFFKDDYKLVLNKSDIVKIAKKSEKLSLASNIPTKVSRSDS